MTVYALIEHSSAAPPLELYTTDALFPIWKPTRHMFTLGYKDEIVGHLEFENNGPQAWWKWSLHDSSPSASWRAGTSPTFDLAIREIARRFKKWIEEDGDPKPPRWKRYWDRTISERLAGDLPLWPPNTR